MCGQRRTQSYRWLKRRLFVKYRSSLRSFRNVWQLICDHVLCSFNHPFGTNHNLTLQQWYMPKDSPSTGLGHRHDWEGIVVWLSGATTSATLLGVAASAHGDFDTTTSPNLSGTSPLIRYYSTYPVNHQLGFTSTVGGQQPLIAYESLTSAARTALENTDFGKLCC